MTTCQNCGFTQPDGSKCVKCSSLFSYYSGSPVAHANAPREKNATRSSRGTPDQIDSSKSIFARLRKGYVVVQRVSLAALVIVVLLMLHKAPPPQIPVDQQATARAESKFAAARAAIQQNHPYQLTLDRTELNSYLNSNLQLSNHADSQAAGISASPAVSDSNTTSATSAPAASADEPSIAEAQSSVKDVEVDMDGDLVKAYVVFDFHGKDMSLELDGHLSSSNGYLQFEPVTGHLGSLPLPQSTLDSAVAKLMSSPENREKLRLPPGISDLKVENGQLVVNYN